MEIFWEDGAQILSWITQYVLLTRAVPTGIVTPISLNQSPTKDYFNCLFHPSKVGNPSMWNWQGSRTFLSRWSDEIFPIGRVLCTLNCLLLLSCFPLWENNQEKNNTLLLISMDILCRLYCKGEKMIVGFVFFQWDMNDTNLSKLFYKMKYFIYITAYICVSDGSEWGYTPVVIFTSCVCMSTFGMLNPTV